MRLHKHSSTEKGSILLYQETKGLMDCHGRATRFQKSTVYMAGTSLQRVKNISACGLAETTILWNEHTLKSM
jgi:hypothetical protein